MPRPKNSSPKSYKAIYDVLVKGPKCYSDIVSETGLHRNTVASRLKHLIEHGFLVKNRVGERVFYEFPRNLISDLDWIKQWAIITSYKDQWELTHVKILCELNRDRLASIARKVRDELLRKEYRDEIYLTESQELLKIAREKNIPITLKDILINLATPYCKECMKDKGLKEITIFKNNTGELICPKCGLVVKTSYLIYDL